MGQLTNQSKGAVGSALNLVTVAASTVTSAFEALGVGAEKLNLFANDSLRDQKDTSVQQRAMFRTNLVSTNSLEQDKRHLELEAHFKANPGSAERYAATYEELFALFDEA